MWSPLRTFRNLILWLLSIVLIPLQVFGCDVQNIALDSLLTTIDDSLSIENPSKIKVLIGTSDANIDLSVFDPTNKRYENVHKGELIVSQKHPKYCEALLKGAEISLSIAPGVTNWHVFEALKNIDFLKGDINNSPTEGMLAAATYSILQNEPRQSVVDRMVSLQENILAEMWSKRQTGLPLTNKSEALILASIIEKETSVSHERTRIASVFVNRLIRGMPLQTDPTVIYGITKGEGVLGRGLRRSELEGETPWNTYKIMGLPPTPIANPGRAAIEAALNPEPTEYIFFVADGTGGHAFAKTLAEHNRNVVAWRKKAKTVSNDNIVDTSCASKPSSCSLRELCSRATYRMMTDSNETKIWWRSDQKSELYVKDAKRRGIFCGVVITSCGNDPKVCSGEELCAFATVKLNGQKQWSTLKPQYVNLAQKKGLQCGVLDLAKIEREKQKKIEREKQKRLADQKQIIKDIQLHLNKHGCKAGVADGIAGRKTQAAIKRFLSARKITRTPSDKELRSILMKTSGSVCVVSTPKTTVQPKTATKNQNKKSSVNPLACAWGLAAAAAAGATAGGSLLLGDPTLCLR